MKYKFLFCLGYGHISPQTRCGRLFCICYALLGIPLLLIMLGEIGIRIHNFGQRLDKQLNHGWFPRLGKYFRLLLISVFGFTLFILIPAAFMISVEEWDYDIAVYYSIISLTTIGFGDFVAGNFWIFFFVTLYIYIYIMQIYELVKYHLKFVREPACYI